MRAGNPDAVVVGAGPNGLVAAVTLARAGWRVVVIEAAETPGGGTRTAPLTGPGFLNDVCSAIHPLAIASPAFAGLSLVDHGVNWIQPTAPLAHPLDGGRAALLERSVDDTAGRLGADRSAYQSLFAPLVEHGRAIVEAMLSPLSIPHDPLELARFGWSAIRSVDGLARSRFETDEARALLAGMASHAMLPLTDPGTGGYGLFLGILGHLVGWPLVEGGSQRIADALVKILNDHGGEVVTGTEVTDLTELPPTRATILDVTPRQLLRIAGDRLPTSYAKALRRFRYGSGVFKLDLALDGPIPWTAPEVARAATVHLGGTIDQIAESEAEVQAGRHAERPLVLLAQPSGFDRSRAPAGMHTIWAYCHVPHGSDVDQTEAIERQIERFAPCFRGQNRRPSHHGLDAARGIQRQRRWRRYQRWRRRHPPTRHAAGRLVATVDHAPPRGVLVFFVYTTRRWCAWDVRLARSSGSSSPRTGLNPLSCTTSVQRSARR